MTLGVPTVNPQEVTITNLQNNPGILPYKLGSARVKSNTHSFIHYFDLEPIRKEIQTLKEINENLTLAISLGLSHPYYVELDNFIRAISFQMITAEQKFNSLSPAHRVKRGLVNALGSIIKSISGNLDAEDAAHYDKAISDLENNQKKVVTTLNKQISLTSEILENFNETVTLIRSNQQVITAGINKIRSEFNKFIFEFNDYLETRNVLDQLNLSLNLIIQLLSDIENAVTFARLGTFHSSILKIDELSAILNSVTKFYSTDHLIFPNFEKDLHKYYDLLKLEAYYSGTKIVFVIHFPIVYPEKFTYYHLYSIPTQNSSIIIPKNSFLIMNEYFYQYTSLPCIKTHPGFFCQDENLINGIQEEECVFQLLQLQSTPERCHPVPVQIKANVIEQINDSHYIAIFPNHTKIQTICGRTDFTVLQGIHLIHLPYQCQFGTKNEFFINEKPVTSGQPMLLPKIQIPRTNKSEIQEIIIQDVPLDKLHEIQKEQKRLQPIKISYTDPFTFNYWQIPIWLIIITVAAYYILKIIQKRRSTTQTSPEEVQMEDLQPATTRKKPFFTP